MLFKKIALKILELDGNGTSCLSNDAYRSFLRLNIELFKCKYDIRYCPREGCECHPETHVKKLIKNDELRKFLIDNQLLYDIELLIEQTDTKKTIYDRRGYNY